jgi:lipase
VLSPALKIVPVNGLELAAWEWDGAGPPLLFAHATGFHGRVWDYIVRLFQGRRCVAVDFRGHGRSSKPEPPYHWPDFGRDLGEVAARLGIENAIGIGHSMGGHSVVSAMLQRPETFRSLLLVDPTIFPRAYYKQAPLDASFVRRRRNSFQSPQEMFDRFENRPPFSSWHKEILRDYCDFGVLPSGGQFVLACPPAVEASIYEHSKAPESNLYPGIPSIDIPVVVMRAETPQGSAVLVPTASPAAPDLATHFPRGRDVPLGNVSHFIPMEAPGRVAGEIERLLLE